jgi:hypothetical protein
MGFARGGSFTVPPGFPNDSFPMRVSSGERVSVTPAGQSAGGMNVTLVYSPAVSLGSQEEAENILMPFVERGIRNAQSNNLL